jgi:aryl-alcohol dehydrogenase-like predicted oxidoreductase
MLYRKLGKTGLDVSAIGFGAWNIGGQWGDVAPADALATIKAAYDAGVTFFDTADAYGNPPGLSEELIGQALRGKRDKVVIATKVGNFARRQNAPLAYTHPLHIHLCCDASLRRMRIDTIDVYQCHIGDLPDPSIFLEAFETLVKQGKVRCYGISTNSVDALARFNRDGHCSVVQLDYSFLNRTPEQAILPYAKDNNIGVIVRGPLAQGLAAGKFTKDSQFTDSVREKWNTGEGRAKFLQRLDVVDRVRFLEKPDRPMSQAALQFVISHPAVSVAIPGAKSPAQARANAMAGEAVLGADELAKVQSQASL